jgi:ribonuclease D
MSSVLIDTSEGLRAVASDVARAGSFGLDMEFSRERTYYPRLELAALAVGDEAHLVDPLALADLGPLWDLVADPGVEVVLHSARQDLEIVFKHSGGAVPANIFDTQIAASLLGFGEQVPYGDLLHGVLGVKLTKLQTRTDWSQRPLTERQVAYAVDDVRYLVALRRRLGEMLLEKGREAWAAEEMAFLADPATHEGDPRDAYRTVKGYGKLSRNDLAVLRELAAWREFEARRRDHPRKWVMADDILIDLARRAPRTREDMEGLRRLPDKVLDRQADTLLEAVGRALSLDPGEFPDKRRWRRPETSVSAAAELGMAFLRIRAAETGVATSVLASPDEVMSLAQSVRNGQADTDSELLRGWRADLVGRDLVDLMAGRVVLRFDPKAGRVLATPV